MNFKEWLFNELTLDPLYRNISTNFPQRLTSANDVKIVSKIIAVREAEKYITINAVVGGSKGNYNVAVKFLDVEFLPHPNVSTFSVKSRIGVPYNVVKLAKDTNDVQMRCDCDDFKYTFSLYNQMNNALLGPEMIRSTSNKRNPGQKPGMCKHIICVLNMLEDKGMLVDTKPIIPSLPPAEKEFPSVFDPVDKEEIKRRLKYKEFPGYGPLGERY